MIYVDDAVWQKPNGRKYYAHMTANSLVELHEFAASIGVKKHFFHRGSYPHYDITDEQRDIAIANGAKEVSSREIVLVAKQLVNRKT